MKLEDLTPGARVRGLAPSGLATVKMTTAPAGADLLEVIYQDDQGKLATRVVYREDEASLVVEHASRPWAFTADGALFRLAAEALRIRYGHLFDPYLAVTTSAVDPLPHQISAVYEHMLPRHPLRFLLADDPGAGKTIMAGLLVKELVLRSDLHRCLIVAPGSLVDQWQDELHDKFDLDFEIFGRAMLEASPGRNPFDEHPFLIARLDQLSRSPELQELLKRASEWDLIICDEAHRMSAHYEGGEPRYTRRWHLGDLLSERCRHFLLMTATPHNGHDDDFQLFLSLLDGDRFEGKAREGTSAEVSDLMRRLVKEDLYTFEGKPLFPERRAYTVQYALSDDEAALYQAVTKYVREEMNRAERFTREGDPQRKVIVGFALMMLQRRLASSPEAILRSLVRRRERLEARLRDEQLQLRGATVLSQGPSLPKLDDETWDDLEEEAPQEERDEVEGQVIDYATAAKTISELKTEIVTLRELEALATIVRTSEQDAKWRELVHILDDPLMRDVSGHRRKLVIFTEFKDTLLYLAERIRTVLGRPEAVVVIHGAIAREQRRATVAAFMNDPEVLVLVANDAAGEGVNLQRAHLMVNYDLPWNPNRLEQRFGRIHRIGQKEVCHLWNLIAQHTREGEVYLRLLQKLDAEREALQGKVYDILGQLFEQRPLRELLFEAVQYGDDPIVRARLEKEIDGAVDRDHLDALLARRALVHETMDPRVIEALREQMERARARRLQPHFIESFFLAAFEHVGGRAAKKESGRYELKHVPSDVRERARLLGRREPVLARYERVCFDKGHLQPAPRALLVSPGTGLLDATTDLVLERYRGLLKEGALLIDPNDSGLAPRLMFVLEHEVKDGRRLPGGAFQVVSRRLVTIEARPTVDQAGEPPGAPLFKDAGDAPWLDWRPATSEEAKTLTREVEAAWLVRDWEGAVTGYALTTVAREHLAEARSDRLPRVAKVETEVRARLMNEINYWDLRAGALREDEAAGKRSRLPAAEAEKRADDLRARLKARLATLNAERAIMAEAPRIIGGALVIPAGLVAHRCPPSALMTPAPAPVATEMPDHEETLDKSIIERAAMDAVMAAERAMGREPRDVSAEKHGYDIESRDADGELWFVEVKGKQVGSELLILTKNEILCALNVPDRWRLAIVQVEEDGTARVPVYVSRFPFGQPGFAQTHSTYKLSALLSAGGTGP